MVHLLILLVNMLTSESRKRTGAGAGALARSRSRASLPGNIAAEKAAWVRCFPMQSIPAWILIGGLALTATVLSYLGGLPASLAVFIPFLIVIIKIMDRLNAEFEQVKSQCQFGCLTASKVVSTYPYLVAVYTDMRKAPGESWPVVKIVRQPLERAKGKRLMVDERLATVCVYKGTPAKPYWTDINPLAVCCITDDFDANQIALDRITADEGDEVWQLLDGYLEQIPKPYRPGLYRMHEHAAARPMSASRLQAQRY